MRTILITRPRHAVEEMAARLIAAGHGVHVAPMMEYVPLDVKVETDIYHALIFTSMQAVSLFARLHDTRGHMVFTVGDATAEAAMRAGFSNIHSAKGDSGDVISLIHAKAVELSISHMLHPCSEDTPDDIASAASVHGIRVARLPIYRAQAVTVFPDGVRRALQKGEIDTVALFSARTAAQFAKLVRAKGLEENLKGMEAVCISAAVAHEITNLPWRAVRVAERPNLDSVMEILTSAQALPFLSVEKVAEAFGGLRPLANRLGLTASTVQGWIARGAIPEGRVQAVLKAAHEDGIDVAEWTKPARRNADRRHRAAQVDAAGNIVTPTYVGPDRRAHDRRQQARVSAEKIRFVNRSLLTGSFFFVAIVMAGVFLMAPEYARFGNTPISDVAVEAGHDIQHSTDDIHVRFENLARGMIGRFAHEAMTAIQRADLSGFTDAVGRLRATPEGRAAFDQSMNLLRGMMLSSSGGDMNAAVEDARAKDPTLDKLIERAGPKDAAAAAMLLILGEFRENVDGNRPYAQDMAVLQKIAGNDPEMKRAIKRLAPYAEKGIISRGRLQKEFKGMALDIAVAEAAGKDVSVRDVARKRFERLLKEGGAEGDDAPATVARAQALLDAGDIKGAMRELQKLDGAAAETAAPWMQAANGRVEADAGADALTRNLLQMFGGN